MSTDISPGPGARGVRPYVVALLAVGVMLSVRVILDPILGGAAPLLLFTLSVVLAGWYGGTKPALLATAASLLTGWYLFLPVRHTFRWPEPHDGVRLAVFLVIGVMLSILSGYMHRIMARSRYTTELFRRTLVDAPLPMMLHREDGQVLALSHEWTTLAGYTLADIPTIDLWTERAYGGRKDEIRAHIKKLYRIEEPFDEREQQIRTLSGETRTWTFRSSPMGRDDGGQRLVLSVAQDVTERKRAERERAAAHQELQATLDSITDGLVVLDREWRCAYFSETGARMLGMRREDLIGRVLWDLFPEAVHRRFYAEYHKAVETGTPVHFEEYYPEPLNLWLECHGYPSTVGLSVYFRDITERKRVETTLRERTAKLDSLLDNAPIGFAFFDREYRYVRINERLAELNEQPVEAHIGRSIRDVLPEVAEVVQPVLQRVFDAREPVRRELNWATAKHPELRYFIAGFYPVLGEDRQVAMVGAFLIETTEKVKAEEALRESRERHRLALDSARMGTFDIALDEGRVFWDERSRALFGLPLQDAVDLVTALACVHTDDQEHVVEMMRVASGPESNGRYEAEYRIIRPDGSLRWIVSTGRVFFEGTGSARRPVRLIGVNHDVTERKQTEIALAESEERFRIAAGAAQLGLFEWDARSGQAIWHNARMYEIFGRTPEQGPVSQASFKTEWLHPDDVSLFSEALTRSMQTGKVLITARIRHGGDVRWLKFEGALGRGPDGSPGRLIAIAQDVTETRWMEQELRQKEAFLTAVIEGLPVGVVTTDFDGRVASMNAAALRLHGFASLSQMLPHVKEYRVEFELKYPDGRAMPLDEWPIARAARGEYVNEYEVIVRRTLTGTENVISYTAVPVRGGGENIIVFVMQDVTQRRRNERLIRESEAQYRALFESIDEGFCVIEMMFDDEGRPFDYRFIEANPAFERHTGLVQPEGHRVREMVPNLDGSWLEIYGRVARTGEPVRVENDEPTLNRTFDVYAFRIGQPEQRRVAVLFNDITVRKQNLVAANSARREAESQRRLLDAVLDSLPVGVIIADAGGGLMRWNEANKTLWGLCGVDAPGTSSVGDYRDWKGWWPDTGRRIKADEWAMARALLKREVVPGDLVEIERFDGTGRRFMVNMAAPVLDGAGNVIAAVVAQTDVTDRVNMERQLRESEDKFRTISENIPQMAWMADENGRALWHNQRWFDYTGTTPDNLLRGAGGLVHADDGSRVEERWQTSLRTGGPYEIEFRCRRHDGVYRWFLCRAVAIRDGSGRIVRWFGTHTDIHEQKSTEVALRRSNEDLQQFAYVASHDLQEPLRTVVSFSQVLMRRHSAELDGNAMEYLGFVSDAALRMSHLVRDLLVYSRATRDGDRLAQAVELEAVLDDILGGLHARIEESGAEVQHGPLPVVTGDRTQLGQVLQNLISNSLKYTRPGVRPEIRIQAERQAAEWVISVRDNGEGFRQQFAERIFGIFKRLHGREVPGTGIGLAICRTIVERHGGRTWAESSLGEGATFFFTLPAAGMQGDQ